MKGGMATIRVIPGSRPQQCWSTKPIPFNLRQAFDRELDDQVAQGIIEPAEDTNDPAMWLHPMVVTRKKDPSKCRITVDLRAINKATLRPVFPAISPWQTVSTISPAARFYTVLDGLKGYHQVELDPQSRRLLTFVTPRGRMRYKRLPMGWHGAGDLYHERLTKALADVPAAIHARVVEDILVHTPTGGATHRAAVRQVLEACRRNQISINEAKVQYGQTRAKFAGFLLEAGTYQIDPDLATALREFPRPTTRTTLRSFLGLAQQVGYFTDEITTLTAPLRELNSKAAAWTWTGAHEEAFNRARHALSSTPCLAPFDPTRPTELLTDAAKTGLGFILRQRSEDGAWRPIQYGSRSLAGHEANWNGAAELEALAVAWAAHKANYFLDGLRHFTILTDSSPLVAILNDRRLDQIKNDRLLKLRTAMAKYNFTAKHQEGKRHLIADALSRAPAADPSPPDLVLPEEDDTDRTFVVASAVAEMTPKPSETNLALEPIKLAAATDQVHIELTAQLRRGWPPRSDQVPAALRQFWGHRAALASHGGLILHGSRIYIPTAERRNTLQQLHAAHQGINKTMDRANRAVWWPTITNDVAQTVARCTPCREHLPSLTHQPLLHGPKADRPFQILHADLAHHAGGQFLILTDEYSGWLDIHPLPRLASAAATIGALRAHFLAHTVPEAIHPDNGPQFAARETLQFLAHWQVQFRPSAPHLPRTNGRAEAAVKAAKRILRGATPPASTTPDPDQVAEGVIAFRNTPRFGGRSPAEWVYGRNLKDRLPTHHTAFAERWQRGWRELDAREAATKRTAAERYDSRSRQHTPLAPGDQVWVQDHTTQRWTITATVVERGPHDIYSVKQPSGRIIKRNRVHLRLQADQPLTALDPQQEERPPAAPDPQHTARRPDPDTEPPAARDRDQPSQHQRPRRQARRPARYRD